MTSRRALVFISVLMMLSQAATLVLRFLGGGLADQDPSGGDYVLPYSPRFILVAGLWFFLAWRQWRTNGGWSLGIGLFAVFCLVVRSYPIVMLLILDGVSAIRPNMAHNFLTFSLGALGLLAACCFVLHAGQRSSTDQPER